MLFRSGMEGPPLPFEGKAGWCDNVARERFSLATMGGGATPFKILDTRIKYRPCSGNLIAPVLAAEKVSRSLKKIDEVKQVIVEVHARAKETGGTGEHTNLKRMFYTDRPLFDRLMQKLTDAISRYLLMQIEAGVDAVQIFDSRGGMMSDGAFADASGKWIGEIIRSLKGRAPAIVFSKGTNGNWDDLVATGTSIGFAGLGGNAAFAIYAKSPNRRTTKISYPDHPERPTSVWATNGTNAWIMTPRGLIQGYGDLLRPAR